MAYLTYRVEITRDESRRSGAPSIEITAYIDRVPETNEPEFGRLSRAYKGVWNSRLQYTGDFESLSEALVAIETAYPRVEHIRCYEYSVDNEYPNEMPPQRRLGKKWSPGEAPGKPSAPTLLARGLSRPNESARP